MLKFTYIMLGLIALSVGMIFTPKSWCCKSHIDFGNIGAFGLISFTGILADVWIVYWGYTWINGLC